MKNFAFVYHYWNNKINNLEYPIIPSITTLRYHNKNSPIYVLDYNGLNWENYDKKLNFKVIKCNPLLKMCESDQVIWRLCSLPFDSFYYYENIKEENIFKIDVDTIWLANPEPVSCDYSKFCCRYENTGIFYFNKKSHLVNQFFIDWKKEILKALKSINFRNEIWDTCKRPTKKIYEEIVLYYMTIKGYDNINNISHKEHYIISDDKCLETPNNIHLVRRNFKTKRGLIFLILKESKEIIKNTFNKEELNYLFENYDTINLLLKKVIILKTL